MDEIVVPNKVFLQYITLQSSRNSLKRLIENCSTREIKTILELIGNFILGNIPFEIVYVQKLKKYKSIFEKLWEVKLNIEEKRGIMLKNLTLIFTFLKAVTPFIKELNNV